MSKELEKVEKKIEQKKRELERLKRRQEREERRNNKEAYLDLVDRQINLSMPKVKFISDQIREVKEEMFNNFKAAIEMKRDLYGERIDSNQTHTFTNKEQNQRITLIRYMLDDWDDTVTAGLDLVKQRLESYAVDENSASLVRQLLTLISKNKKGDLRANSVLRLRKFAEERNDEEMMEAVSIIESAYNPILSKTSIKVEQKNEVGAWVAIPLSATDA